ncbi:MAG: FKBP-type peptidyl-prolyl cis-trans isomerase [Flavobacteriales bacterium]
MISRRFSLHTSYLLSFCIFFWGCKSKNDGFTDLGDSISIKLTALGDCSPALKDAEYFVVATSYTAPFRDMVDGGKISGDLFDGTGSSFHTVYCHSLSNTNLQLWEDSIHWRILKELSSLNCGDEIMLRAPLHAVNKTFLCAYEDVLPTFQNEMVEIQLKLLKTFDEAEFRSYLQAAAQHGEMTESEAVELLLIHNPERPYTKHGDCFIASITEATGDTIHTGDELTITYTTHLLDGTQLDEPTEFQFTYGRPGQIVEGLHYALSFMQKGDEAMVYLPSNLAFGNDGSKSGIVPPNTPVYFTLKIADSPN